MSGDGNTIRRDSTSAADLGGVQSVSPGQSDASTAFNAAARDVDVQKSPATPQPTLRLNPSGVTGTPDRDAVPFRQDTSAPLGDGNTLYMQQPFTRDGDGSPADPTFVRVNGGSGPIRYNVSAGSNQTITGNVSLTTADKELSGAVSVSRNTTPDALNPTTLGANGYALIPGTQVGAYGGITTNRLNPGEPGSTTVEGGVIVTSGGRNASGAPNNSIIAGVRSRDTVNAAGVETSTTQGFVRADGVNIGSVSTSGEIAVSAQATQVSVNATTRLGPNWDGRLEGTMTVPHDGAPVTGTGALMIRHTF